MGLYNMTFYTLGDHGGCSVAVSSNFESFPPRDNGLAQEIHKKLIKFIKFNRKLLQLAGGCH